jgi:hypothetical protein
LSSALFTAFPEASLCWVLFSNWLVLCRFKRLLRIPEVSETSLIAMVNLLF